MKTKLNPGHFTLQTRALAALVIRNGNMVRLTRDELANIQEMEVDINSYSGEITIRAIPRFFRERRKRATAHLAFPDRRRTSLKRAVSGW